MAERVARTGTVVGWLIAGDWRQHPARIVTAVIAIATGVALGFAVHLVNAGCVRPGSADREWNR
jgi:putative ABC transport system permease protein